MNSVHAFMPAEIFREEGALRRVGEIAKGFGKRCLIMTSASAAQKSRALDDALRSLKDADVEAIVFPYISQNPTLDECRRACDAISAARANSVLAIGGGSVMDAAKAAAWMSENFVLDPEKLFSGSLKRPPLPLMLCGTTAGTGSEVSAVAVITDDTGKKRSVKHPYCFARCVFADPRYTDTMPRAVTVSTALDALCHAVEGYLSPACDRLATIFANAAIPKLMTGLCDLLEHDLPSTAIRDELFDGALLAGMVLNACGTAFPHPMGYVLTEDHGIPHGQACAVFLPALLECAKQHTSARAASLFALCGGEDRLQTVLSSLTAVDVTMTDEQLTRYAERFAALPHYARVPGGFDGEQAITLCRKLFEKRG